MPASGSEQRIVPIAASLTPGHLIVPLYLLAGLDMREAVGTSLLNLLLIMGD